MWVISYNFYFFLVSLKGHIHKIRVTSCHINSQSTLTVFAYFLMQPSGYIIKSRGLRHATFFWKRPQIFLRSFFKFHRMWIFLESSFLDILALYGHGGLSWFCQFLCQGLCSFNLKGFCSSDEWSCSLCKGKMSFFCTGFISRKLWGFFLIYIFNWPCSSQYIASIFYSDHLLWHYSQFLMSFHLTWWSFLKQSIC